MATPPFVISNAIPGDTDIVSQFPGVDRGLRDVVNTWLLVDHNNNPGGHVKLTMDQTVDPAAVTGKTVVSARTDGSLVKQVGSAPSEYVGNPPGTVIWHVASSVQGYLLANGQAVSRTTFATLFTLLGVGYGGGDGSTTFNLPNLVDRQPIGAGNAYAVGATGGEATHVLTIGELASHAHTITEPNGGLGHQHGPPGSAIGYVTQVSSGGTSSVPGGTSVGGGGATAFSTANITINSTGSGTAHNNLAPYLALYALIKY
jgi:microcystin-dependent protein